MINMYSHPNEKCVSEEVKWSIYESNLAGWVFGISPALAQLQICDSPLWHEDFYDDNTQRIFFFSCKKMFCSRSFVVAAEQFISN